MNPTKLSNYYRDDDADGDLTRRRWAVGLSLFGALAGQIVSLYQTGVIGHLPDPPKKLHRGLLDSDKVDASDYAYKRFDTPDGLMMVMTYAQTALLSGGGGPDRANRRPWLSLLAFGKAVWDVGLTAKLAREEDKDNKALCTYCQAATLASVGTLVALAPEAWRAGKHMLKGS